MSEAASQTEFAEGTERLWTVDSPVDRIATPGPRSFALGMLEQALADAGFTLGGVSKFEALKHQDRMGYLIDVSVWVPLDAEPSKS